VDIDWGSLVEIAVVAAAASLTVVLLVAVALVALSAGSGRQVHDPARGAQPGIRSAPVVAGLCVLAAGLIVCYGIYLIIA
jgi:hypothetical protein